MILYPLFRHVHATLALLALVLMICAVAIEGLLLSRLHLPLTLATEGAALGALDGAQRDALGYLAVRSSFVGWSFALLIFPPSSPRPWPTGCFPGCFCRPSWGSFRSRSG